MRAVVLHGPGDYRLEKDWPDPVPQAGWARVHVMYSGICGSDLPRFGQSGSYHYPVILGHEFMGVVDTPAPGSSQFAGGERVAVLPMIPCGTCEGCRTIGPFHCRSYGFLGSRNDGGFAEYCLAPEANLIPLPPELDARAGALIEPIAVALHAVRRARFEAGMSALVYGAGPIGLLIAFWLRTLEAKRVQLADVRKESLVLAKEMGVTDVFDPSQKTSRGPADADVVFEAAGSQAALRHAIERTASKGSIMLIGRDTRDTLLPVSSVERLMRKEVSLLGCWGYDLRGEELFLQRVLAQTSIPIARLITHEIGLEEAPSFIPKMLEKRIYYGKVLLRIAPERT